jgi:hypothetical protein
LQGPELHCRRQHPEVPRPPKVPNVHELPQTSKATKPDAPR